jgi:hypothetical protein
MIEIIFKNGIKNILNNQKIFENWVNFLIRKTLQKIQ